ncbi:MAG: hypothetical protein AB8H47_17850 [Bacteroidia bacterium]
MSKILFSGRGWKLQIDPFAAPAVAELLGNTIWGTKGGIRYSHTDGLDKVNKLADTTYLTLWRESEIRACVGFVRKELQSSELEILPAYYIRYLAVAAQWQAQTTSGSQQGKNKARQGGNRLFRKKFAELYEDADYWRDQVNLAQPVCFYAYVVMDNDRSANLVLSNGFEVLRSFRTMVFSRFRPKRSPKVRKIKSHEIPEIEAKLKSFYQEYSYSAADLRIQHDYYVWEEEGEIIAGVQAQTIKWTIEEIPGLAGKIAMNVLPKVGFLRRILNPEDFRFAGLDALFYQPGAASLLPLLYEHILADLGLHISMIWFDDQTHLYDDFVTLPAKQKGLLSQIVQGAGAAHFLARSDEAVLDRGLAERLKSRPHYIPVGDLS